MFGNFQFGRSQFAELGELVSIPHPPPPQPPEPTSLTFGGGSGRYSRYFSDRKGEPLEHILIHRALSVAFDGESTCTAKITPRAFLKARFSRETKAVWRIRGLALMQARQRPAFRNWSMKLVGRFALNAGALQMRTEFEGDSQSQMQAITFENALEDILSLLDS